MQPRLANALHPAGTSTFAKAGTSTFKADHASFAVPATVVGIGVAPELSIMVNGGTVSARQTCDHPFAVGDSCHASQAADGSWLVTGVSFS